LGVLAMVLAGGLAALTPSVAQARDWDDHGRRFDRREYRYDRWDHRYHRPIYFDRWGRPCR